MKVGGKNYGRRQHIRHGERDRATCNPSEHCHGASHRGAVSWDKIVFTKGAIQRNCIRVDGDDNSR
jgi:hypothetical protein